MVETPNYYAILPANVRYDKRLKANVKLMYAEVTALSQATGYCFASNNYFAKLYEVNPVSVSRWISQLVKYNYIQRVITYKEGTKEIDKRYLSIVPVPVDLIVKGGIDQNVNTPIDNNVNHPINNNVKDNTTSNSNNININIEDYFNSVWKLYPKKQGKGQISKTKKKAMLKYTVEQWKIIINRYDKSVLDKTYLVNGSTFFNGRYLDYTDENYTEQNFTSEKKKPTDTLKYRPNFNEITEEDNKGGAEFFGKFKGGNLGK